MGYLESWWDTLKSIKYFLGNTWCFDMSKIMKFLKISLFPWNYYFSRQAWIKFFTFSQKSCFRTRAAGCRECCLNQWNTIHFGGSWAPWARFLRKSAFSLKFFKNVEKVKTHGILHFSMKKWNFMKIMTLQKHQYFLRNIKVLGPPDSQKSRISINFMMFMKFLGIS